MLGKGWYLQGQMSKDGACLITSRRMYEQYRRLEEERRMREEEAAEDRNREKAARAQEEEKRQSLSPEVQKVLEEGDAYVKKNPSLQRCDPRSRDIRKDCQAGASDGPHL